MPWASLVGHVMMPSPRPVFGPHGGPYHQKGLSPGLSLGICNNLLYAMNDESLHFVPWPGLPRAKMRGGQVRAGGVARVGAWQMAEGFLGGPVMGL